MEQGAHKNDAESMLFDGDIVLGHTAHCTVRPQESQHLIYNNKTDEMHLVSPTGAYIYELCDGSLQSVILKIQLLRQKAKNKVNVSLALHRIFT